jgi:hypothetical protein
MALRFWLKKPPVGDIAEYFRYAVAFWHGSPPLTALPVEYPPLAILPFSLTLLPFPDQFAAQFMLWTLLLALIGFAAYVRFLGWRRGLAYLVYLTLGATGMTLGRFDLYPALVTVAALWVAQRRRFTLAYLLLALGVLLKLYPIFLMPLLVLAHWQAAGLAEGQTWERLRRAPGDWARDLLGRLRTPAARRVIGALGVFVGALALAFGVAFALNPSGALTEFTYASARPLQIESTPAALLWLFHFVGFHVQKTFTFKSYNLEGPLDVVFKPLSTLALAAGCVWAYWRFARGRLSLAQAFLAVLAVVIATNKIFSPQYLVWVTPFVAEVYGFDGLWLLICALTTLIYPILYYPEGTFLAAIGARIFEPVIFLRDMLLLVAAWWAITRPSPLEPAPVGQAPAPRAPAPSGRPDPLLVDTLKRPALPRTP